MSKKSKIDNITFNILLFLLFLSFFEESVLPGFSSLALVAVFLIPVVILFWFLWLGKCFNKADRHITVAFVAVMLVQIFGISFDALYISLTPIYRSFTALAVVLYIRHSAITERKCNAFLVLSVIEVLLGFLSFILPNMSNGNIFYGNLNTVGVLFFTLFVLNALMYLKSRRNIFALLALLNVIEILISRTRTSLFLVLATLILFMLLKAVHAENIKPKIFFSVMIILLTAFVLFYYNIKELSVYEALNQMSKKLFNKNFDSGRPDLWHYTVEAVDSKWFFGQGTGVDLENFISWTKTSHSVYFDVYLQNGIIGVVTFIISILVCLNSKGKWTKSRLNIFIMITAFIVIFFNAVGVVLIKPRSGIGLLHWILIAIPYVHVENDKKKSIKNDKPYSSGLQRQRIY